MIILICILFILFLIWTYNMVKSNFKNVDSIIYNNLIFNDDLTKFFKIITNFASSKFWILVLLLLFLILKNKNIALIFAACLLFNSCLIGLIKNIFKRERPNINRLVNEKGYSYPSGHTMSATSFYGLVIFFIIISPLALFFKIFFLSFLIVLVLLIGFSRIYLGVHYFSDVIGGLLIASCYILLFIYCVHFILNLV